MIMIQFQIEICLKDLCRSMTLTYSTKNHTKILKFFLDIFHINRKRLEERLKDKIKQ